MWVAKDLTISMDLTTQCNAGCPLCQRTDLNTLRAKPSLKIAEWSLEQFSHAFTKHDLDLVKEFEFCGNWGESTLARDFLPIISYILSNSKATIDIKTNGSTRNTEWWSTLGEIGNGRVKVFFSIESTEQDTHSLYRQRTSLRKILSNMQAYTDQGGYAGTQTVVFKHNENQIDGIIELAKSAGAVEHLFYISDRLNKHEGSLRFIDTNNQTQTLEYSSIERPGTVLVSNAAGYKLSKITQCSYGLRNKISINIDGSVVPCCYISTLLFEKHQIDGSILTSLDNNNIKLTGLKTIVESKWFQETLPQSWNTENELQVCSTFCSLKTKPQSKHKQTLVIR